MKVYLRSVISDLQSFSKILLEWQELAWVPQSICHHKSLPRRTTQIRPMFGLWESFFMSFCLASYHTMDQQKMLFIRPLWKLHWLFHPAQILRWLSWKECLKSKNLKDFLGTKCLKCLGFQQFKIKTKFLRNNTMDFISLFNLKILWLREFRDPSLIIITIQPGTVATTPTVPNSSWARTKSLRNVQSTRWRSRTRCHKVLSSPKCLCQLRSQFRSECPKTHPQRTLVSCTLFWSS